MFISMGSIPRSDWELETLKSNIYENLYIYVMFEQRLENAIKYKETGQFC